MPRYGSACEGCGGEDCVCCEVHLENQADQRASACEPPDDFDGDPSGFEMWDEDEDFDEDDEDEDFDDDFDEDEDEGFPWSGEDD